jgi:hypothetical protein
LREHRASLAREQAQMMRQTAKTSGPPLVRKTLTEVARECPE